MSKFLEIQVDLQERLKNVLENDFVVVSRKDLEKVHLALAYGRIKLANGEVQSNTNFQFALEQPIKQITEKRTAGYLPLTVIGRVDWLGFENDYVVCPVGLEDKKEKFIQIAESKIEKI